MLTKQLFYSKIHDYPVGSSWLWVCCALEGTQRRISHCWGTDNARCNLHHCRAMLMKGFLVCQLLHYAREAG